MMPKLYAGKTIFLSGTNVISIRFILVADLNTFVHPYRKCRFRCEGRHFSLQTLPLSLSSESLLSQHLKLLLLLDPDHNCVTSNSKTLYYFLTNFISSAEDIVTSEAEVLIVAGECDNVG